MPAPQKDLITGELATETVGVDLEFPVYCDDKSPFPEHLPRGPQRKAWPTPSTAKPVGKAEGPTGHKVSKSLCAQIPMRSYASHQSRVVDCRL